MFCSECGTENQDNANYCISCGQKIGVSTEVQKTTTPVENNQNQNKIWKSVGPFMFGSLRFVRGFCGLLFALQIPPILSAAISWSQQPDAVTGVMVAILLVKVIAIIVFGGLFFLLRNLINRLHIKINGIPHPALVKRWSL